MVCGACMLCAVKCADKEIVTQLGLLLLPWQCHGLHIFATTHMVRTVGRHVVESRFSMGE